MKRTQIFVNPAVLLVVVIFTALITNAFADPQLTSWLTAYSGQYARVYTTTARRTSDTSSTTWTNQSVPVYADIEQVLYSTSWIYVRAADLPSYRIGPWLNPQGQVGTLWPANQQVLNRFPRTKSVPSSKMSTGTGYSGLFVNGVAVFNFADGKAWDGSNMVSGQHSKNTYYWHRNAPVGEDYNFDYTLGHQTPGGVYHTHQQPIALRYQLGDHVDLNSSTKKYTESTNTVSQHSPIIGWAYDGNPIYGPYGYSISNNAASGVRRMVPGYVQRDGSNGTDNISTNLSVLPAWYARYRQSHFSETYSTTAGIDRPSVNSTYPLGTFAQDYSYLGDLTNSATGQKYVQGTDYDLDVYNGRFCVTPEFPSGTYAYFVAIDSSSSPTYPYTLGFEYYGNASGGSVSSITESVTTNFLGGADATLKLSTPTITNTTVTLVWSSTEGGTYQIESSTNQSNWTVEKTNVTAAVGVSSTTNYTTSITNGTGYVRITRTALATYDSIGAESGVVSQTDTQSLLLGNTAPTVANSIPDQSATYGSSFSYTFPTNTFSESDAGQTLTYSASSSVLTNTSISFDGSSRTFSATTIDATNGGTIVGSYTVQVIATDNGSPAMSVTNNFTLTINPKTASVTPNAASRIYGATNPVFSGTLSGFIAADSITASYSTTATTNSNVGVYSITATLNDSRNVAGNYSVTTNTGTLTISQATLTVTANNSSRSYGSSNPVFSANYTGFANSQTLGSSGVTGAPSLTASATTNSVIGAYTITNSVGTLSSANYNFAFVNGTLTVTQASLTVTPADASRAYGQTNPSFIGTIVGLLNNDNITANYSTTAVTNSPVGNYPITVTLNDINSRLGNYSVTTNQGTLTVTNTSTIISINFTGTNSSSSSSPMAASELAGVLPAVNWNNSTNQVSGTLNNLFDSQGIATPASVTWSADGIGVTAAGNTAGDSRMMKGYLDITNTSGRSLTVTNIPSSITNGGFDVLVYFDGANGSSDRVAKFTIGTTSIYGMDYTFFSGSYTQVTASSDQGFSTPAGNYVLFTNLNGNSFTLTATPGFASDTNAHAEINGIQIVAANSARTTVTTNPASQTVCNGNTASFTAAAQSATKITTQWQVSVGGGAFTNIPNATNATLAVTADLSSNSNQYQAVFTSSMGSATTVPATLTVSAFPDATITLSSTNIWVDSIGNSASAPAGAATYAWTISNGTVTSATNLQTITYSAGNSGTVTLNLMVGNAGGCTTGSSTNVFTHSTTNAPSFSSLLLTNNQIQFSATGESGAYYIVQATTNLTQPNWVSISTNAAPFTFVDPITGSTAQRFYRVVAP